MEIAEIKDRIDNGHFMCDDMRCKECVFTSRFGRCGGYTYDFDFNAIKNSRVRTLKGILKYKKENNINSYPKLINKQNEDTK